MGSDKDYDGGQLGSDKDYDGGQLGGDKDDDGGQLGGDDDDGGQLRGDENDDGGQPGGCTTNGDGETKYNVSQLQTFIVLGFGIGNMLYAKKGVISNHSTGKATQRHYILER